MEGSSSSDDDENSWSTDYERELGELEFSPTRLPDRTGTRMSDETAACFVEMGFTTQMISRAIEETGGTNPDLILETLVKYTVNSDEASSSNSKVIDQLIAMGFDEESVIKAIHEYGEEDIDELTNVLLSRAEAEKLLKTEDDDLNLSDDDKIYTLSSSDEEDGVNSSNEDSILQALIKMDYEKEEATRAIEICGEKATLDEVIDFICAAQMIRQFDAELNAEPDEQELQPTSSKKKRRVNHEPPRRVQQLSTKMVNDELIRLPNPMIGFGVPNHPDRLRKRPVPLPEEARGPPFFYYENVAMAPKGVWATISSYLYGIVPEFVDSVYFSAAARKRGYIHNLPIHNRFQIKPLPHFTIEEAFPLTKKWWPAWDTRTKLNCLLTCIGSARLANRIRGTLERHGGGDPPLRVQKDIINECKRWNLLWIGKNKVSPLDPEEMELLLGFPHNHTRGGVTRTDRYKSLGNAFQVDTVAYHLSVLKSLYPNGIKVLSLFTGIGGGEVALHRLQIPMKVVVSVEISEVNRSILRSFWEGTKQTGILREFSDVQQLDNRTIERLMDEFGGFDLVIGGSPCNNLAGGNRVSRVGLDGEHSSLFYEYCRILKTVRRATQRR